MINWGWNRINILRYQSRFEEIASGTAIVKIVALQELRIFLNKSHDLWSLQIFIVGSDRTPNYLCILPRHQESVTIIAVSHIGIGSILGPDWAGLQEGFVTKTIHKNSNLMALLDILIYPDPRLRRKALPVEYVDDTIGFNPEWIVNQISPRPILFITSLDDRLVPPEESEKLYEHAGEPKKLVVLKGVGHYEVYAEPAFSEVMKETLDWYQTYLPAKG